MSLLRMCYLVLTVLGTALPMSLFFVWYQENGFMLSSLLDAWKANAASAGLFWDLIISAVALTIWIIAEVYVRKDYWVALVCIPVTFFIGVSAGFPLYLFLRTRPIK